MIPGKHINASTPNRRPFDYSKTTKKKFFNNLHHIYSIHVSKQNWYINECYRVFSSFCPLFFVFFLFAFVSSCHLPGPRHLVPPHPLSAGPAEQRAGPAQAGGLQGARQRGGADGAERSVDGGGGCWGAGWGVSCKSSGVLRCLAVQAVVV